MESKKYDFVIIGSGMGGLATSVILAKQGYSVLVLEKNHQIGGALQVFSRDKCIFDTGVHYLGGLDKGENLYRFFKYLEIYDDLKLQSLDRDCFDMIRFADGSSYKYGQGYKSFAQELVRSFPEEADAINMFCDKIKEICDYFPMYNLNETNETSYYKNPEILTIGAWDYVCSLTQNDRLRNVLLGSGPLYAGEKNYTPLYVVALIVNSYIQGSYRLVDGGSQLAKQLTKRLREKNGVILKHKEVIGANYDDSGMITSVKCADGTSFEGKHFISNLHPALTIEIFGKEQFLPAYRKRIQNLENTVASFMVYISLQKNSFPYINHNIYDYYTENVWETTDYSQEGWPQMMYICTPASSKSATHAESICIMCYMSATEVSEWENTFNTVSNPEERGEAYRKFKEVKQELVVRRLETKYPTIRKHIRNVYSSSPLTYKDYIGTPGGSLYGIKKNFNNPASTIINTKTRIQNLYLTGQNIIFHGILGATIGAFVTCLNFIDYKKLMDEIKSCE